MRRARARSRKIGGPDGISTAFQVSAYSREPFVSHASRNLLSKDRCRAALGDEFVKSGPEVSFVGMAFPLSRARKRLTGTASGPHGSVVGPSGSSEGERPSSNPGEPVRLGVSSQVIRSNLLNIATVNVARREQTAPD